MNGLVCGIHFVAFRLNLFANLTNKYRAMKMVSDIAFITAALSVMFVASPANACRVPTEPFNPALAHSDIIVVGRVTDVRLDAPIRGKWFRVRIQAVVAGQFPEMTYEAGWATGPGACGSRGPDVVDGDQVVFYFSYRDGRRIEQGWTKFPALVAAHR